MKRLHLSLLGSKTVIQAARSISFNFVLRCHTSSPKGRGRNLLISNSVAEIYFPACLLDNKNLHRLLDSGHLPTPEIPKRLSIIFLWADFYRRAPTPIVNPLQYTVCICCREMACTLLFGFAALLNNLFQNFPSLIVLAY